MKFLIVLLLVGTVVCGALTPRHINPKIPIFPISTQEGRITNGDVAQPKQFPYQVGLFLNLGEFEAFCGGSLISSRWIVTAAHCADNVESITVVLGTTTLNETQSGEQKIHVHKTGIFVHEEWNPKTLTNDIALIKLPVEVQFSDYVKPIKLPKINNAPSNYVNDIAVASGWGRDSDSSSTISQVLRYIYSRVITNSNCNFWYFGQIKDSNICITGEKGRSTCNGDSGGPLAVGNEDDATLIGLTSFGIALGCEANWPAVFTRVSWYLDWIKSNTGIAYY